MNLLRRIVDRTNLHKMNTLFLALLLLGETTIGKRSVEQTGTGELKHVLNVRQGYVAMWQGFHVVSLYVLENVQETSRPILQVYAADKCIYQRSDDAFHSMDFFCITRRGEIAKGDIVTSDVAA